MNYFVGKLGISKFKGNFSSKNGNVASGEFFGGDFFLFGGEDASDFKGAFGSLTHFFPFLGGCAFFGFFK